MGRLTIFFVGVAIRVLNPAKVYDTSAFLLCHLVLWYRLKECWSQGYVLVPLPYGLHCPRGLIGLVSDAIRSKNRSSTVTTAGMELDSDREAS